MSSNDCEVCEIMSDESFESVADILEYVEETDNIVLCEQCDGYFSTTATDEGYTVNCNCVETTDSYEALDFNN